MLFLASQNTSSVSHIRIVYDHLPKLRFRAVQVYLFIEIETVTLDLFHPFSTTTIKLISAVWLLLYDVNFNRPLCCSLL